MRGTTWPRYWTAPSWRQAAVAPKTGLRTGRQLASAVSQVERSIGAPLERPVLSPLQTPRGLGGMRGGASHTVPARNPPPEPVALRALASLSTPLLVLRGKAMPAPTFFAAVGDAVGAAIDSDKTKRPWIAQRWAARSRVAAELTEVVARQYKSGNGPYALLQEKFPGAQMEIHFTGLDGDHHQLIYMVKTPSHQLAFAQGSDGTLAPYTEAPVNMPVFVARIGTNGALHIDVPQKISIERYPLQRPYGVGDSIDFPYEDTAEIEAQTPQEPFRTRLKMREATIVSYTAQGEYTLAFCGPDNTQVTRVVGLQEIRKLNNPHWFELDGETRFFGEIRLRPGDWALRRFIEGARPIIARHTLTPQELASLSPSQVAAKQKACITDLMAYITQRIKYPDDDDDAKADAGSKLYHELQRKQPFDLGELVTIGRGVCRHQCLFEHLLLQEAGIDSRLASGAANTASNKFRGYHLWLEVTLADGERFLSDQTWEDPIIPLWAGAYNVDNRRIEMVNRTARYDGNMILEPERRVA